MSSPGGSGGWGPDRYRSDQQGSPQYVDPITGQPLSDSTGQGMRYQGLGLYDQGQQATSSPGPYPGMVTGYPETAAPRKRGPVIVLIAVAAVLVVGVAATVILLSRRGPDRAAPPPPPAPTPMPSSDQMSVAPVVPGWKGVAWPKFGVAYDVPPAWQPKPGSRIGVGNDLTRDNESMGAYSIYMENYCRESRSSYRAVAGLTMSKERDNTAAGTTMVQNWARFGFSGHSGPPRVAMNPPTPVKVDGGKRNATLVSAMVTPAESTPCGSPTVFISTVVLPTDGGSAMLLGVADQGIPEAVPPDDVNRALTSLRWLPK
jgi:hypothetical protein